MRARLQRVVLVECVVQTNGECSDVRVARGLDPSFGLNEEAIKAAQQWRFRPGVRQGEPVPVFVTWKSRSRCVNHDPAAAQAPRRASARLGL